MQRSFLLALALIATALVHAQKGTISGTITALDGGKVQPLPFVNVALKGTTIGATTDLDGRFTFSADAGTYTLVASFVGYEPLERPISVIAGQTAKADLELKPQAVEMKAVEVVTTKRTETEAAVVMETRKSDQVVNGIGREQISKGQDRTAGDVVKRIPGVTMVGDRFIMVRGLADRYNTVMLNDVMAPSLEADKRAFSFDILPSGALDRVMIYKTGSSELPGEFAGGVIKLHTVSVPAENTTRITVGTGVRAGTTFQPFYKSNGSGTDFLGFDNGMRQLPSGFLSDLSRVTNAQTLTNAGRSLANNWVANGSTAMPDQRMEVLVARRFGKEGGARFGNITSLSYSGTSQAYTAANRNYNAYDPAAGRSDTIYDYRDQVYQRVVRVSAMHNWTALLGTRTKLEFRNLFTQQGRDETTLRTGRDIEGGFDVRNYAFRYEQRTIYSGQLHGSHELKADATTLEWTLGYGLARGKEPDYRRIRTTRDLVGGDANAPYQTVIAPGASTLDAGRFFSSLNEDVLTGRVDAHHQLSKPDAATVVKLRAGVFVDRKDRTFAARWMAFTRARSSSFDNSLLTVPLDQVFSAANINATTGFSLSEGTNPSDRYTAANTLMAGHLGGSVTWAKVLTVSAGVRAEHNRQELYSTTYDGRRIGVNNPVLSILPSVNTTYNLTERALVRAAWSTTVNRPEFRELAPFSFYDFSTNNVIFGNDKLVTATVQNIDARFEHYPANGETVSLGAFYKRFTNPIETYFVPGAGSGGTRNFSFRNAPGATNYGLELELRRSLAALVDHGHLSRLSVVLNAALIHSQVDLGDAAKGQSSQRPMMGQSPYVINTGLYYQDSDRRLQYAVLYNVFGQRLFAVGTVGTPDIYEMPRNTVDASITKGLGKHVEVRVGVQDLLNQRTRLVQDADGDGRIGAKDEEVISFRRGAYFSGGISLTF